MMSPSAWWQAEHDGVRLQIAPADEPEASTADSCRGRVPVEEVSGEDGWLEKAAKDVEDEYFIKGGRRPAGPARTPQDFAASCQAGLHHGRPARPTVADAAGRLAPPERGF